MQPEIIERQTEIVLYVRETGDYKETPEIAFKKLISFLQGRKVQEIKNIYGMGLDNPNETESKACRFDACAKIRPQDEIELDEYTQKKELEGGRFAVFAINGPYSELSVTCNKIFHEWLPTSGCTLSTVPLFCEYTNFLDDSAEVKATKIYLPIKG